MIIQNFGPGTVIDGKYRILSPLGEGGIGEVWLAEHLRVGRKVAIKLLKEADDEKIRARFAREAQALGRLNHPNCLTIYEFGFLDESDVAYLVTEFLEGQPLSDWRGQQIVLADLIAISKQVTTAIGYAHHQGVLHRDLKPENIFLVRNPQGETEVKVLDFGMAKLKGDAGDELQLTKTGEIFGTPAYMSPEQIRGTKDVGPPSDLYALGVIMYELIEGRLPFWEQTSFDLLMKVVTATPPPVRRDVPAPLSNLVMRLLEKDPDDRFQTAQALWDAIDQVKVDSDESLNFIVSESPDATLSRLPDEFVVDPLDHASTIDDTEAPMRAAMPTAKQAMPAPPERDNSTTVMVMAASAAVAIFGLVFVSLFWLTGDRSDTGQAPPTDVPEETMTTVEESREESSPPEPEERVGGDDLPTEIAKPSDETDPQPEESGDEAAADRATSPHVERAAREKERGEKPREKATRPNRKKPPRKKNTNKEPEFGINKTVSED